MFAETASLMLEKMAISQKPVLAAKRCQKRVILRSAGGPGGVLAGSVRVALSSSPGPLCDHFGSFQNQIKSDISGFFDIFWPKRESDGSDERRDEHGQATVHVRGRTATVPVADNLLDLPVF